MTMEQIILTVMGFFVTLGGGAIKHLYALQEQVQDKMEHAMKEQLTTIQGQINQLSNQIYEDRKAAVERQSAILQTVGGLVNRQDLREEMKRTVDEVDRRMQGMIR